jgi:nickel-dependent lactate racemase
MMKTEIKFGNETVEIRVPDGTEVFAMAPPEPLKNPEAAIREALTQSIGSPGLDQLIADKLRSKPEATAVVVISDNTRPVPYRGEKGILWPVLERLIDGGVAPGRIIVLVATGTHRPLTETELRTMLDPRVFEAGIAVINHDCQDRANLVDLGETRRGSRIFINRQYREADLKILTGLVESHFMAGASGGRKSVCPGLFGEEGTYVFHSAKMLASPNARDLILDGNPCHEEALEVAQTAGADYMINVTLDHQFNLTGVFAGDLVQAHRKAVERLKEYVALPFAKEYDLVITHAGFVGINHYQAAKAGVAAAQLVKPGGSLIMAANNTDSSPVGSPRYQTVLHLLKMIGVENFNRLILSGDWTFIPEQWQVQMWCKLFAKIPLSNFIYYSPQLARSDYDFLPGVDGNIFLPSELRYQGTLETIPRVIEGAIAEKIKELNARGIDHPAIAYLSDGPYGIPVRGQS